VAREDGGERVGAGVPPRQVEQGAGAPEQCGQAEHDADEEQPDVGAPRPDEHGPRRRRFVGR
jgi:hypothetical protein